MIQHVETGDSACFNMNYIIIFKIADMRDMFKKQFNDIWLMVPFVVICDRRRKIPQKGVKRQPKGWISTTSCDDI